MKCGQAKLNFTSALSIPGTLWHNGWNSCFARMGQSKTCSSYAQVCRLHCCCSSDLVRLSINLLELPDCLMRGLQLVCYSSYSRFVSSSTLMASLHALAPFHTLTPASAPCKRMSLVWWLTVIPDLWKFDHLGKGFLGIKEIGAISGMIPVRASTYSRNYPRRNNCMLIHAFHNDFLYNLKIP